MTAIPVPLPDAPSPRGPGPRHGLRVMDFTRVPADGAAPATRRAGTAPPTPGQHMREVLPTLDGCDEARVARLEAAAIAAAA